MIVSSRETTSEGPPRVHCRSWQLVRRNGKTKAITQNWGIGSFSCHGNFNFPKGHIITCLILHLTRKLCDHFDPSENVAIKATAISTCRYRSLCNFFWRRNEKDQKGVLCDKKEKGKKWTYESTQRSYVQYTLWGKTVTLQTSTSLDHWTRAFGWMVNDRSWAWSRVDSYSWQAAGTLGFPRCAPVLPLETKMMSCHNIRVLPTVEQAKE